MTGDRATSEAERLEQLWQGQFGDEYVARNATAGGGRGEFWSSHLERFPASRVLEVGCNVGANLRHIAQHVAPESVWGVDVNATSVAKMHTDLPEVSGGWSRARELPFRDGWFDLVFTVAVLIHQPEETLSLALSELVRCSRRYIAVIEYTASTTTPVDYRGTERAFFKRDYGTIVNELFPELRPVHAAEVGRVDGFDDGMGYFVWERPGW